MTWCIPWYFWLHESHSRNKKKIYFIFLSVGMRIIYPSTLMKKTISYLLILLFYTLNNSPAWADGHLGELREIGEQIKQAVKAGKISEKDGWSKWDYVLREYEEKEKEQIEDFEEIDELEEQIEIRELEFELERMEHEHELERLKWEQEIERMEQDFERERREWHTEHMQWEEKHSKIKGHFHDQTRRGMNPGRSFPKDESKQSSEPDYSHARPQSTKKDKMKKK